MSTSPLILSTWSFGQRGNDAAWPELSNGGPALDAVETACRTVEADESIDSVGRGGLPDADGHASLDACVMLSPSRNGAVVAVREHLHVASLARQVMERTPHLMLAGSGADDFATSLGIEKQSLLSDDARRKWEAWRQDPTTIDQSKDYGLQPYLRPVDDGSGSGALFNKEGDTVDPDDESRWKHHDTIGSLAIDASGVIAGACSTSGTPYKLPGRVGDSPIIGHGLYVDPDHGAAVATGTGELVMGVCGAFLAVECMRRGASADDAAMQVLERIASAFTLEPHHQVALIVLRPDRTWAAASLRPGYRTSVRDATTNDIKPPSATLLDE